MLQLKVISLKLICTVLDQQPCKHGVAVHLGVKMADTLAFTAKVDMVDFWV